MGNNAGYNDATLIEFEDDDILGNVSDSAKTYDSATTGGVYATLTVGTSATELKVGGSAQSDRKYVTIQLLTSGQLYWGYDSSVTTSNGTRAFRFQFLMLPVGEGVSVYLIADGAGKDVRIGELA